MFNAAQTPRGFRIDTDPRHNDRLSAAARDLLAARFLNDAENPQDLFARVALRYADDGEHAARMYDYIARLWFIPDDAILGAGGIDRGIPAAAFLNECDDSLTGIIDLWNENVHLAARGGSVASFWGHLRAAGENVGKNGVTSGIIPFIRVMDAQAAAILPHAPRHRAAPAAVFLNADHPEIDDFIALREKHGINHIYHGIVIPDRFMRAVDDDAAWILTSPRDGTAVARRRTRDLWHDILRSRKRTGLPLIVFGDTVNRALGEHQKLAGLQARISDATTALTAPAGTDHHGQSRTATGVIGTVNLLCYDDYEDHPLFIADCLRFLDNALDDFIRRAPDSMMRAKYAAMCERNVAIGVGGFHDFLQTRNIAFESLAARAWNKRIFTQLQDRCNETSIRLAHERTPCPDARAYGIMERFSAKTALAAAPTAGVLCGYHGAHVAPVESYDATHTPLRRLLAAKGYDNDDTWQDIAAHNGSVRHLSFLTDAEKDVFKTAAEIDPEWIIDLAAARAGLLSQSQIVTLTATADTTDGQWHDLHWSAWEKGLKTLAAARIT